MTDHERLKFFLEMWVYKGVEVTTDEKTWTFNSINNLEEREPQFDKRNITSITPIPNPPKLLPVGTKVRVFEEYNDKYWKMEWLYSVYELLDSQYALLWIDDWQSYVVPARAVVPVLD